MSNKSLNPEVRQPYMDAAWFAGLLDEVSRTSVTAVAVKLGFNRSTISQICNGCGPYGKGRSSTGNIESAYRRQYEQLLCQHTQTQVGIAHCRDVALRAAPTHNPMQMMHWQACQQCSHKPQQVPVEKKVKAPKPQSSSSYGAATSGDAAEEEGWNAVCAGPDDNPYPVEDARHDYWLLGLNGRRASDKKTRARIAAMGSEPPQQAGIIDTVTMPLPEVGGPQIADQGEA